MAYVKDRLRRTMLYIPGNNPGLMRDAHIYGADSIMFDLEDSVKLSEKDAARFLVYGALTTLDYGDTERVVRVNPLSTAFGYDDFVAMVRARVNVIRLPKTETAQDVLEAEQLLAKLEKEHGLPENSIGLMAAVESALGILHAYEIATASPRLIGIAIGAEDFVTDLKTNRSAEGIELLAARSQLLFAARAAGIAAIDTIYADVNNEDGLRREAELIHQLGFDGKSIINPRQIEIVHEIFTPKPKDIEHAQAVIAALNEAEEKHLGVVSLNGKMVDKPVADRARRVLALAQAAGVLPHP